MYKNLFKIFLTIMLLASYAQYSFGMVNNKFKPCAKANSIILVDNVKDCNDGSLTFINAEDQISNQEHVANDYQATLIEKQMRIKSFAMQNSSLKYGIEINSIYVPPRLA